MRRMRMEKVIEVEMKGDSECSESVNHPSHYGGDNPYEVIKVLEVWLSRDELIGFLKGNIIKYTARAGKKNQYERTQDHAKSKWYEDYLNDFLRRCPDVNKLENV
jgi:hypothetical protein